jgi:hypothetical protein
MLWIMCYLFQGKVKDPLQLYHVFVNIFQVSGIDAMTLG